ncbi:MAG: hypothetical protein RR618_01185 [Cellulosilyticaceae bacterium]
MKKNYILATSIILCLLTFILLINHNTLKSDVIINKLQVEIPMPTLYYSDISAKKILPYTIENHKLTLSKEKMIPFTEGFLSKDKYNFYMAILKTFAASREISLPKYFHDFYEDEKFVVISFSGDLKDVYIIEKNNLRMHLLNYATPLNLGPMYVSHIQVVDNYLIILAGEAESYNALIYTIYLPTFSVVDAVRLATHPTAIKDTHYTITTTGQCVFINGSGLKVYDPLNATYKLINLDFTPTRVMSYQDSVIALGESTDAFKYAVLDSHYKISTTGELTPPAPNSTIVDTLTYEDNLYIISYDTHYSRYPNYLSIYNLRNSELLYALGISSNKPYALLEGSLTQ